MHIGRRSLAGTLIIGIVVIIGAGIGVVDAQRIWTGGWDACRRDFRRPRRSTADFTSAG